MKSKSTVIDAGTYTVYIGREIYQDLTHFLAQYKDRKVLILVDENTIKCCISKLTHEVPLLKNADIVEIQSGEEYKNINTCHSLWQTFSQLGVDRKSLLINVGGGVIGDMGGFVASTFKRGIDFINLPTTLLAQVDASVGGKTGVNLDHLKNEVGLFNMPKAVFINPHFLRTLSKRQILSGFAEIIKHGLIADKNYWKEIKTANIAAIDTLEKLIVHSVKIKNDIVLADPKEANMRKALNFGHTIGHAIETYYLENTKAALLHGEAVAIGMVCEAWLSHKKAKLSLPELEEITQFILEVYKPEAFEKFDDHRLIELIRHDKKNEKGIIQFALVSQIGKAVIDQTCDITLIKEALKYCREQIILKQNI